MLKTYLFIWISFGFVACWSQSKLTSYAKEITKTLCAPELHGRGYVNDGCNKAGEYILGEFERIGLQPFNGYAQQSFYLGVNTFPGNCKLKINGRKKKPGIDYLVHPSSASYHGKLSLISLNAKEVLSYPFKSHAHGWAIAFIPPKSIAKDTLKMVREKLEKLARIQMPVVEITRDKLTWSVSSEQFKFPYIQVFDAKRESLPEKIKLNIDAIYRKDMEVSNIIGFLESKQPSDSFIIVSAHYDHLGRMGKSTYFPGANDNASGVSVLLNLVKYYTKNPPKYKTLFIFFAGEEAGLLGSKYFVESKVVDLKKIKFLVNFDLLGTGDEGIMVVNGYTFEKQFGLLESINKEKNLVKEIKRRGKASNSDHYWFSEAGVPCFFIYTLGGIKAYHDVYDVAKTLPLTDYVDVFKLVTEFTDRL
jgi:hypothetical protein